MLVLGKFEFSIQAERAECERDERALPAEALATHEARSHALDVDDQVQVGEDGETSREEGQVDSSGEGEAISVEAVYYVSLDSFRSLLKH